jgi:hypothetical protein
VLTKKPTAKPARAVARKPEFTTARARSDAKPPPAPVEQIGQDQNPDGPADAEQHRDETGVRLGKASVAEQRGQPVEQHIERQQGGERRGL